MSSRLLATNSHSARVDMPHPLAWATVTLALAAAGVALFVHANGEKPAWPGWLSAHLQGLAPAASGVLLVVALLALRRFLFARLARRPGPIEIVNGSIESTLPGLTKDDVADVLAEFHRRLAATSLSSPQSIPNAPAADNFLENVSTTVDKATNVVATVAGLMRAVLQVRHAYRVTVQIRRRDGEKPCGILIQIQRLPNGAAAVETVWDTDWRASTERAAHAVGAFVLPRSRLAHRPPWTAWRGCAMPVDLFHHSQVAKRHLGNRDFELALDALHRALKIDPQNPYLRIDLAQVLEQLGLFLDATAAYADVVAIESWTDRRLWLRLRDLLDDDSTGPPPGHLRRSHDGPAALLIARYRLVCRLAAGEELAAQWFRDLDPAPRPPTPNNERARERRALRKRLGVWLERYVAKYYSEHYGEYSWTGWTLGQMQKGHRPDGSPDLIVETDGEHGTRSAGEVRFRHFLQFVALREARLLADDYRWSRGRRRPGMPVTQTGMNMLRIWAPMYLSHAGTPLGLDQTGWPREPDALDEEIHRYLTVKPAPLREWQEHYNAACVVAVALRGWRDDDPRSGRQRNTLARQSIRHLERAVSSADSGYVARFAQWLSTGDQDLNPLRSTHNFVDFLDRYLPNDLPRAQRPQRLFPLLMSLHTFCLARDYANAMHEAYAARTDARTRLTLSSDEQRAEREAFGLLQSFVCNDRDWHTRHRVIVALAARRTGDSERPCAPFPNFQDEPAVGRYASREVEVPTADYPDRYYDAIVERRDVALGRISDWMADRRPRPDELLRVTATAQMWATISAAFDDVLAGRANPIVDDVPG